MQTQDQRHEPMRQNGTGAALPASRYSRPSGGSLPAGWCRAFSGEDGSQGEQGYGYGESMAEIDGARNLTHVQEEVGGRGLGEGGGSIGRILKAVVQTGSVLTGSRGWWHPSSSRCATAAGRRSGLRAGGLVQRIDARREDAHCQSPLPDLLRTASPDVVSP